MTKFKVGDTVECSPQGPYLGNRIGVIKRMSSSPCNKSHLPALVEWIDCPCFVGAWVKPIRILTNK